MENYNHTNEDVNEKLRNRFITISVTIIACLLFIGGFLIGHLTK